jgi:hypothetical protein
MKKLLAGCLVIIVLGAVVIGVGSYFLYRAASPLLEDARSYLEGMSKLEEIERGLSNTSPYSAPASGELNEPQVQRFVRVQQHVRTQLGRRMTEIEEQYKHLRSDTAADRSGPAALIEMLNALRDITGVYVDARRYQVEALNKEGFSQEEYSWVRDRMFQAAGMEIGGRIDIEKLQEAIRNGTGVQMEGITADRLPMRDVPAKNRELVKPYVDQMDDWLPLVFFGL